MRIIRRDNGNGKMKQFGTSDQRSEETIAGLALVAAHPVCRRPWFEARQRGATPERKGYPRTRFPGGNGVSASEELVALRLTRLLLVGPACGGNEHSEISSWRPQEPWDGWIRHKATDFPIWWIPRGPGSDPEDDRRQDEGEPGIPDRGVPGVHLSVPAPRESVT